MQHPLAARRHPCRTTHPAIPLRDSHLANHAWSQAAAGLSGPTAASTPTTLPSQARSSRSHEDWTSPQADVSDVITAYCAPSTARPCPKPRVADRKFPRNRKVKVSFPPDLISQPWSHRSATDAMTKSQTRPPYRCLTRPRETNVSQHGYAPKESICRIRIFHCSSNSSFRASR